MKLLIFIYLLSSSLVAFAYDATCDAIVRNENNKLVVKKVTIKDLTSRTHFQGRYIKIVKQKSNYTVAFDSPEALRACTVYYHSTIAKDYFSSNFDLKRFRRPRTVTMRIEMDLGFEESVHMMHENNGLFYNNAVTIPPSGSNRLTEEPWFYEIWYAPKKKVKVNSDTYRAAQLVTSGPFMASLLLGVGQSQATTIGIDLIRRRGFGLDYYAQTLALSIGVTALVPNVLKWVSRPIRKTIYLDTSFIPEVIYHEYTHYALSEHLSIDRHAPVVEGVANFYAALIGKTDSILGNTRGYSKGLVKVEADKTKKYEYSMEDKEYAQLDFTFKFLYALKKEFGEEFAKNLVFNASTKIGKRPSQEIKKDLLPSLKESLIEMDNTISNHFKLNKVIQEFGF